MNRRMQFFVIIIYACVSVAGVTLFKLGSAEPLTLSITTKSIGFQIGWVSILGILMYIASFLIYLSLVSRNNLTYLTPVSSGMVYVLTLLVSVLIFGEKLTVNQMIGWGSIMLGLFFMNIK